MLCKLTVNFFLEKDDLLILILVDDILVIEEGVVMSKNEVIKKVGSEVLNLQDRVFEKIKEIEKYQLYDQKWVPISRVVDLCSHGYVQNFDKFFKHFNLGKIHTSGFARCPINLYKEFQCLLKCLNDKAREFNFCYYALLDSQELFQIQKKEIENYNYLLRTFSEYPLTDKIEYHEGNKATFEQQIQDELNQPYIRHGNFDVIYGMALTLRNNTINGKVLERSYKQVMKKLIEIRNQLKFMGAEEFRKYKVDQLRLSLEEQNKFENNISLQQEITDERYKLS